LLVLALVGALVAVIIVSRTVGGDDTPPPAPEFQIPDTSPYAAADVKQRSGENLTLILQTRSGTEEQRLELTPQMAVERLTLIDANGVQPGDWVTIVGVTNPVKNFSAHSLIVIPGGGTLAEDGLARSPLGFTGAETARDPRDRPILGGVVVRIENNVLVLQGPTSEIRVTAGPEAPARLYRIESVEIGDISEGDRIASTFDSTVEAVLVLPGGASG
jgi:hypothetical protein